MFSLLVSYTISAQKEFYSSKFEFLPSELENFYSSINWDSNQIYFIANDYNIHAINRKTGKKIWSHYLASKTNISPIIFKQTLLVEKHISEYQNICLQLNCASGDTIKTLKTNKFETQPLIRDGFLYGTSIIPGEGGSIIKYDIDSNKIIWSEFIAHGVSKQPYFFKNSIVANAESDNWFDISYDGIQIDTICVGKNNLFAENIKCHRSFKLLTFDRKPISDSFLEKHIDEDENFKHLNTKTTTIILGNDKILIIGKNRKIKQKINLSQILDLTPTQSKNYFEIFMFEENLVYFFYNNEFVIYDTNKLQTKKLYDLSKWNVHQLLYDFNKSEIWLISKNDGQLYGISL